MVYFSLCIVYSSQVVVGTAHGRMGRFDLRMNKPEQPVGIYKSFAGAVRDLVVHPHLPLVFSVALDRFLRVHHLETGKLIHKVVWCCVCAELWSLLTQSISFVTSIFFPLPPSGISEITVKPSACPRRLWGRRLNPIHRETQEGMDEEKKGHRRGARLRSLGGWGRKA